MSKKSKRERLQRQYRKYIVIVVAVAAVLGIIAVVAITTIVKQFDGDETNSPATQEMKAASEAAVRAETSKGKLRDEAKKQLANNDTAKAEKVYQDAIASESEVNQKIQLYVDLANVYYDVGRQDEAIATAEKALKLSSDKYLASDWLARAYEDRKEYAKALEYLKTAKEFTRSPQNIAILDTAYYDSEIARVTKLAQGSGS